MPLDSVKPYQRPRVWAPTKSVMSARSIDRRVPCPLDEAIRGGARTMLLMRWRTLAILSFISDSLFLKTNKHMWRHSRRAVVMQLQNKETL